MIQLNKDGNRANVSIEEWIADYDEDVAGIPSNTPFGSFVMILESAENGGETVVKVKNSEGRWVMV